jgi:hypothetical protein
MSIWLLGVKPNRGLMLSEYMASAQALLLRFSGIRIATTSSLFFGSVTQSVNADHGARETDQQIFVFVAPTRAGCRL